MNDIFQTLQNTFYKVKAALSEEFKDKEITYEQFVLLSLLKDKLFQSQQQIADMLNKDKPNITRMIDILERKGFLSRQDCEGDRRKYKISLSPKGVAIIEKIEPIVKLRKYKIISSLSEEDKIAFMNLLEKAQKNLFIIFLVLLLSISNPMFCIAQNIEPICPNLCNSNPKDFLTEIEKLPKLKKEDLTLEPIDLEREIELVLDEKQVPVTFERALDIAMKQNFDIQILESQRDERKWRYYNTKTTLLPDINYTYSIGAVNGQFLIGGIFTDFANEEPIQSNFNLTYDVFTGLRRYYEIQASKFRLESKKSELEFTKDKVLLDIAQSYYLLLRNKLNIEIQRINLAQFEEQYKINQNRFKAGVGTKFDVLRAEAEVASAKQALVEAFNRLRLSQAQLANDMGINVFTALYPEEMEINPKTLMPEDIFDLHKLNEIALCNRDDLKSAKFNIDTAKSEKKSAYSIYIPQVNIAGQIADQGTVSNGIGRNYAIYMYAQYHGLNGLGARGITEIKARDAALQEQTLNYTNNSRKVQEDLLNAYYNTIAARDLIKTSKESVNATAESLRLAFLRLKSGIGIYIDVLQAQTSSTSAKTDLLNAIIGYNISQARLLYEAGIISPENLLKDYKEEDQAAKTPVQPREETNEYEQKTEIRPNIK